MSALKTLIKNPLAITLSPQATIADAAKKMAEHLIGSILVMDVDSLVGIFTERDLLNRVVAKGLDPKITFLSQVMSKNVTTIDIGETVEDCFEKMETTKCRHI